MKKLNISTFGAFTLEADGHHITDTGTRVGKPWVLVAYLLYHRGSVISQKKLIELLWGDSVDSGNPENTLRITLHRARTLLNGLWPEAGKELIVHKEDGYCWNEAVDVVLDYEEMQRLYKAEYESEEKRLHGLQQALMLYKGEFLEKFSFELWVIPTRTYFHNMYLSAVMEVSEMLSKRGAHADAAILCWEALSKDVYNEKLCLVSMQEWIAAGDNKRAIAVYEALEHRIYEDFGIHPGDELRKLYRNCRYAPDVNELSAEEVLKNLQEPEYVKGALFCDYGYFKILCFAESRAMERNGNATHICLLSVTSANGNPLSKRVAERTMDRLGKQIQKNLRRGDTVSRCSASQFIIMLPKANYENSCMVCRRIIGAFNCAYPNTNVKIRYVAQPLLPTAANLP